VPDDGTDYGDYTSKWEYLGKGWVKVDRKNILVTVHCTENPIYLFPEMKLRSLVLNFTFMYL
jgi:hypothetical protein